MDVDLQVNSAYIPLINSDKRFLVLRGGAGCFVAGTCVAIQKDLQIRIEDIKVGDMVPSFNFLLNKIQLKRVTKIHKRQVAETMFIPSLHVECTPEHKFWNDGMYVEAQDLFANEMQWRLGDKYVYDITVEGNANFYINTAQGLKLVHNSGKSVFLCQLALLRMLQEDANGSKIKILCTRKVGNTISNSIFAELKNVAIDAGIINEFKITNRNPMSFKRGNSEIIFAGIDDPEKIKSVSRVDVIWMEEATEFDFDDFKQLNIRLRGEQGAKKQMWVSFNPIDQDHWLRTQVWDNPSTELQGDMHKLVTTYRDNKFLDKDYIKTIEGYKTADYNYYRIYGLGDWGTRPEGLIYASWKKYNNDTDLENPDIMCYALDFGYNDPMALIQVKIKDKKAYVRELVFRQKLTMDTLINMMETIGISKSLPIYCDAASPEKITMIQKAGFNAQLGVKGHIESGIQAVKLYSLYIHEESLNVIKELSNYSWKIDSKATRREGNTVFSKEPSEIHNHSLDALRYAIQSIENKPEPFIYSPFFNGY
jgi:phage terminase large subunit